MQVRLHILCALVKTAKEKPQKQQFLGPKQSDILKCFRHSDILNTRPVEQKVVRLNTLGFHLS